MNGAYQLVFDLVSSGQVSFEDLTDVDMHDVVLALYKEASTTEQEDWLLEPPLSDLCAAVELVLARDCADSYEELALVVKERLFKASSYKARKLFEYVIDNMEENDQLCQQDSDYTEYVEGQL